MSRSPAAIAPLLISIVLGCAGAPDRAPSPADTVAVRSGEARLASAMIASDTAVLAALWAPEYVSTSAVGHTSDRAQSLMAYGAGLVRVDSVKLRDIELRPYGEAVVALGFMDWTGAAAGQPFKSTVRFQHVWAGRGDSLRIVASQLTNQP